MNNLEHRIAALEASGNPDRAQPAVCQIIQADGETAEQRAEAEAARREGKILVRITCQDMRRPPVAPALVPLVLWTPP